MDFQGLQSKKVSINRERWTNYKQTFGETLTQPIFTIDKKTYMKKARLIYDLFRKMNSRSRTEYLKHFSLANWNGLPESQKSLHTMSHCHACQVHHFAVQSLFPNTVKFKPQKLVKEVLEENGNVGTRKVKPTQKAIKTAAKHIYSKVNGHFQKIFNISFAEAQN